MFLCSDLINIEIKSIRGSADPPKIILGWYWSSKKLLWEEGAPWREMIGRVDVGMDRCEK